MRVPDTCNSNRTLKQTTLYTEQKIHYNQMNIDSRKAQRSQIPLNTDPLN